jgi:hypothetical protein
MLLSNTGVGNMTIPSSKIVINTRHTTSERKFRGVPARGRVLKPSRTLMKSLMECSSSDFHDVEATPAR